MNLSEQQKNGLLNATRSAAAALVEDLQYIRSVAAKLHPTNAEIRRLSGLLRRILVENDLQNISAPRLGRILLLAPDNNSAYQIARKTPFLFFMSGRATVLGGFAGTVAALDIDNSKQKILLPRIFRQTVEFPKMELDKTIDLSLDGFRSQRVLSYRGKWVNRQNVIQYVANIASGVHTGQPRTESDEIINNIRHNILFKKKPDGSIHVDLFPSGVDVDNANFRHDPDGIDPVLIELLAAAMFLVSSPFIQRLDKLLQDELRSG